MRVLPARVSLEQGALTNYSATHHLSFEVEGRGPKSYLWPSSLRVYENS